MPPLIASPLVRKKRPENHEWGEQRCVAHTCVVYVCVVLLRRVSTALSLAHTPLWMMERGEDGRLCCARITYRVARVFVYAALQSIHAALPLAVASRCRLLFRIASGWTTFFGLPMSLWSLSCLCCVSAPAEALRFSILQCTERGGIRARASLLLLLLLFHTVHAHIGCLFELWPLDCIRAAEDEHGKVKLNCFILMW